MSVLGGGGKMKASSSMEDKILQPFLCLVVVIRNRDGGLVRVNFPTISICILNLCSLMTSLVKETIMGLMMGLMAASSLCLHVKV